MNFAVPCLRHASRRTAVPVRLTSQYNTGCWMEGRTPARAARWTTTPIGLPANTFSTSASSRYVPFHEREAGTTVEGFQVAALHLGEIEVVEVVEDDDVAPLLEERLDQVRIR